jgi:hypothetical protein
MDEDRLRTFGLVGGGGALLVALGVVVLGDPDKAVERKPAEPPAATISAAPSVSASAPIPPVETALSEDRPPAVSIPKASPPPSDSPAQNPTLEFIVRFDDRHPLAQAQALYLQGKRVEAAASARETLARRPELAGLCFDHFTFGAELVLTPCTRVPRNQVQRTSDRWTRKLRAMKGVQYADANVIVQTEGK